MPEHIRTLIVILILATPFFSVVNNTASAIIGRELYSARRNLWFVLTLCAFLSPNFWVFAFIAILLLLYANRRESNTPALFFFILFALPVATVEIPGFGLVNYLFLLSYYRILALFILLPAFFRLLKKSDAMPFGRMVTDKVLFVFLLLSVMLNLRDTTFTDTLRQTLYICLEAFLPYFVISRSLKNLQDFKDALMSLVLSIMLLALIAVFEAVRHWLLYVPLTSSLGFTQVIGGYLERAGGLRAITTAGQPIALGYLMAIGIGFFLFLQQSFQQKFTRRIGFALLAAGLIAPMSRGPWVGVVALVIIFIATGRNVARRLMSMTLIALLALPLVAILPGGDKIIDLLPFIGSTEKGNITYRQDLFNTSITVIQHNPWFGSINFLDTPEMESLRHDGLIDIVNGYIEIALAKGLTGLGLFVGFFLLTITSIYRAMGLIPDKDCEEYLLGRALLATLVSMMVILSTVSSVTIIPIVYWSIAGLGIAYVQMVRKQATL